MNDLSDVEERELNPSPRAYKVSTRAKVIFLACGVLGFGLYAAMLVERRLTEQRFLTHQDLMPIKMTPVSMPSFTVLNPQTLEPFELTFNDGTYTLLNIWATWCPPCQEEMPSLAVLQQHLQGKLRVIALSVDDDRKSVVDFIKQQERSFTVLWDDKKFSLKFFNVEKYPETFLITPDGNLATQFSGPRNWASPEVFDYFSSIIK
jgi:thiol-disulfide isomerase/thioredoxin